MRGQQLHQIYCNFCIRFNLRQAASSKGASTGDKYCNPLVATQAPVGIGKSFLLDLLSSLKPDHIRAFCQRCEDPDCSCSTIQPEDLSKFKNELLKSKAIAVTFNNFAIPEIDDANPLLGLAIRIIYCHFIDPRVPFASVYEKSKAVQNYLADELTLFPAFLMKLFPDGLIIAIDELKFLGSVVAARLLSRLGGWLDSWPIHIIVTTLDATPILSKTLIDAKPSNRPIQWIPLGLISYDASINMVPPLPPNATKIQKRSRELLIRSVQGHPRLLEYITTLVKAGMDINYTTSNMLLIDKLLFAIRGYQDSSIFAIDLELIRKALINASVNINATLTVAHSSYTVHLLISQCTIMYTRPDSVANLIPVHLTPLSILYYCLRGDEGDTSNQEKLLKKHLKDLFVLPVERCDWGEFEILQATFEAVMRTIYCMGNQGSSSVAKTISEFYKLKQPLNEHEPKILFHEKQNIKFLERKLEDYSKEDLLSMFEGDLENQVLNTLWIPCPGQKGFDLICFEQLQTLTEAQKKQYEEMRKQEVDLEKETNNLLDDLYEEQKESSTPKKEVNEKIKKQLLIKRIIEVRKQAAKLNLVLLLGECKYSKNSTKKVWLDLNTIQKKQRLSTLATVGLRDVLPFMCSYLTFYSHRMIRSNVNRYGKSGRDEIFTYIVIDKAQLMNFYSPTLEHLHFSKEITKKVDLEEDANDARGIESNLLSTYTGEDLEWIKRMVGDLYNLLALEDGMIAEFFFCILVRRLIKHPNDTLRQSLAKIFAHLVLTVKNGPITTRRTIHNRLDLLPPLYEATD